MNDADTNFEYVEPSNAVRIILLVLILVAAVTMAYLLPVIDSLNPGDNATPAELEQSMVNLEQFLDNLIIFTALMSFCFSLYFLTLAYHIKTSRRYPPPHFAVIRRTRIKRGPKAHPYIALAVFVAVLCWLPVLTLLYLHWIVQTLS